MEYDFTITLPDPTSELDQDKEYFILERHGKSEKIMFHDYDKIYAVPGLYENIFQKELKCQSPSVIANMLVENADHEDLRVLDYGAGNGLVGEELSKANPELIVGVDILDSAKEAAHRDK